MSRQHRYFHILLTVICTLTFWAPRPCEALVVSEVMYHPVEEGGTPSGDETLEFIELYNNKATREDMGGYAFTNGVSYTFPAGTILPGKEYLVIAHDPAAVEAAYGITGVYGPYTGRLNNDGERIELSNANGAIIISFSYNDARPWPASADGTGHSIILAKAGGDPEEASSWAASTVIGGTPGEADEMQAEPEDPTLVTLVDLGHPGRYFKGVREPSGGTTSWTTIGFNDNPATTDWIDGDSGYGYSNQSAETDWIRTTLDDMKGTSGVPNSGYFSAYARLRFDLTAEQIDSFSELRAEVHYDDGYVLYLNGTKVGGPVNLTGDPPAYNQAASSASEYSADNVDLTGFLSLLDVGTNVLSIQFHNAAIAGGSSDCLGSPVLRAVLEPEPGGGDDVRARLVINEMLANSDAPPETDWIELYNPGPIAVDLSNIYLSDGRFELLMYKLPDGVVLEPGEFWTVREAPSGSLPFALSYSGETIFLTAATDDPVPQPLRVLDAVRFPPSEADVTFGRYPDGADNLQALSAATYGTGNAQPLIRDIVINEIMYHHGSRDERYEYVELYNKGAGTVSLDGWSFTDGITYDFNEASQVSSIPAGGYLVVAKDPTLLEATYNNLTIGVNLVGPYRGHFDHHSERIRLSYPYEDPETHDVNMIAVDEVTYYDGGRWPVWADGQGASLELRDPRSHNDNPDAWAASDESEKADWEQFSFTVAGGNSQYTHDSVTVFDLMLLNQGDVLVDDLELIIGSNRLSNGGFESGETSWRILGNHVQSFATTEDSHSGVRCLHVRATGHGDPGANRINQSISSVTASTVTFRGWARWLRGTRYMLLRASRDAPVQPPRPANSFELTMPMDLGTPGAQNSVYVANRGPEISGVRHDPVLPAGNEPIVVTARVTDNDGVASVTLYYRSSSPPFASVPMLDNGMNNDLVAGDGIYTGMIPGASGGTMYSFYVEASDGSASTRFPTMLESSADVPNRTCMVRVGDAQLNTAFATYRVWMSDQVVSVFGSRANLSNELMDCTFVYNDTDVFYNARIRLRGSPFIRSGANWDVTGWNPWRLDFNADQKFRGREEINLDRTEDSSRGPLQERASYWFYRKMGLQYSSQEYVRPIMNGNSYQNYEDVQKSDGDYVDSWFPQDNDGYIHKIDDYFEYSADGTGFSMRDEGLNYDGSHPLLKETYRWGFEKRSHRENDEWQHLFDFAVAMNTSSTNGAVYEAAIESVIHPYHFASVLAIRHAVGDWDSYGYNRGKNNWFYYALPEGRWYLLPWDIDFTLGSGDGSSTSLFQVGGQFPEVSRFLNYSKYRNLYLQAVGALVYGPWQTSHLTANPPTEFDEFLDDAANALIADGGDAGRRDGIKSFVRDRRSWILNNYDIPSLIFEITTNGGDDFCTSESIVTIGGVAPPGVEGIALNGSPVAATFMGSAWEVDVPVGVGANLLEFEGLDGANNPVAEATDSITVTRVLPIAVTSVSPSAVCNNGTAELTVHGSGFAPGSSSLIALTGSASTEIGFDALYVQNVQSFDRIDYATQLLDNPEDGVGDAVHAVHTVINLFQTGEEGVFSPSDEFAAPFNSGDPANFAARFTGYVYAPSPGVRYFGVNSDDGFVLFINGEHVGEYPTGRAPATTDVTNCTSGTMTFNFPGPGSYYLVLDFFENAGGEEVEFFQTNSTGGNPRLINEDAELVVFRDDVARVNATDVVVVDENTITFRADLSDAEPNLWTVTVTPECAQAAEAELADALEIVACRANFNHDDRIDFFDWAEITNNWGRSCSAPLWCDGLDLDKNGRIDFGEAAVFADEWLLPR